MREMNRYRSLSFGAWVAVIGLVATAVGGTWWAAQAMIAGESISAMFRVAVSGLVGAYYALLFQASALSTRRFR